MPDPALDGELETRVDLTSLYGQIRHVEWENHGKSSENHGTSRFSMGKPWKITIFLLENYEKSHCY